MNEQLTARERRREFLITLSYTIFSVLMIIITPIEQWPLFYMPLIAMEIAFIWWSYVQKYRTYYFRAIVVTTMICINIFLYGIQGENFQVLIPTLCVQFVLLSLYEMTGIMNITIAETVILFLYHAFINPNPMIPDDQHGRNRFMLQLVSFVVLIVLCIYIIRHHAQEEQDVKSLEKRALREQKIKDDFMANTSHELRTPVNTISGMCEILLQKSLPEDVHSGVLDIQMTGVELQNIVTDIMDYAALESGAMELKPGPYNITSTLNDVMNMTVFENREKNLEIIFDCNPNIPQLLEGDEEQLRRVLKNLISNAIKFTSEGGVTVKVTYREEEYGINLIVSVKDTGVGLSLEERERILRDFYQSDSDRNRSSSGVGLGLSISSSIINKMGGFLTIKSKPGQGSEFAFSIPQKVLNEQPCISLKRPGSIKLIWYYNPQSQISSMRDAFVDHIKHFSDYFGIVSQRATSLEECKRRIARGQAKNLIIGQVEYIQDHKYFDDLAETMSVIMVADRNDIPKTSSNIHVLYKPYNAIMLAEILNGTEHQVQTVKKKQKRFIAPNAKILAVDDNLMNLKVVEGLLKKYKIKIVAATSGEEALSLIDSKDFDFVFMDHMMPGMDGVECFHRIRDKEGTYFKQVPIIALTANAIAGSREMFLAEGFNEFIAKPIDTALLNDVLHRFIPKHKQIDDEETKKKNEISKEAADAKSKSAKPADKKDESAVSRGKAAAEGEAAGKADIGSVSQSMNGDAGTTRKKTEDTFEILPDIDKETALTYCGSLEDFMELAEVYCKSGRTYEEKLQSAFDEEDMKNYALLSHTIKSTSKTLGALELSELAFTQETAAKEDNAEVIKENHEKFKAMYGKVLLELEECIADADEGKEKIESEDSPEITDWDDVKLSIKKSLESYETKALEECIDKLKGQTLDGKPIEEVLDGVLQKASNFDFEGAIELLDGIGGKA